MLTTEKPVIIVEDDISMSQAIERLLRATGFHTSCFSSAEALLAESDVAPACLVLDICLPGISGFELHERLAGSGLNPPVIFITAHDKPTDRQRAKEVGAVAYLAKPFPGRDLVVAVATALGCAVPRAVPPLYPGDGIKPGEERP